MPDPQQFPLASFPTPEGVFHELGGITTNWAKEDLSIAFVTALVAHAGLQTNSAYKHDDGIDLQIGCEKEVVNGVRRRKPCIFVQMKATSHPELTAEQLIFRFKTRADYDKLAAESTIPQALIVYVMPDDRQKWLVPVDNHMDFVGHAFFFNMADAPPLLPGDPPKVEIPIANRLTTHSLIEFFCDAVRRHFA